MCLYSLSRAWSAKSKVAETAKTPATETTPSTTVDATSDSSSNGTSSDREQERLIDSIEAELREEKLRDKAELELRLEEGIDNWLEQYKFMTSYVWDPSSSQKARVLDFTNHDRTVENPEVRGSYWGTTRATRMLNAGHSYRWEIEINQFHRATHNTWWIIVGVESPQFPFESQSGNDVIGYQAQHTGVGLIIGPCRGACRGERIDPEVSETIEEGDVIGVACDMTLSSEANDKTLEGLAADTTGGATGTGLMSQGHKAGARMEFYLLRNGERKRILVVNNIRGQQFYPAVSMNQGMRTTIRPSSWL